MRPLTTLALFVASLILGVVIWWGDHGPADGGAGGAGPGHGSGKALLRLDPDALGRIQVSRSGNVVNLEKRGGLWFIESPIADRADAEAMDALLDLLSHLTVLDRIPMEEVDSNSDLSPESLGLTGEDSIRLELTPAPLEGKTEPAGPPLAILLGNPAPLANALYASIPESDERAGVYVVDGNPRPYLEDPVAALRDRHLFLTPGGQIVELTVKTPRGDIAIKRKITPPKTDWAMTRPLRARADRERIDRLFAALTALRVESVVSSGAAPAPPPDPIPEGSAALILRRYGVEEPLVLYFSPAEEQPPSPPPSAGGAVAPERPLIEVTVSDRSAVFQARSDLLDWLPDSPNAFRDPHLARIPTQAVFGVAIESRGNPPVILKTARSREGARWFSERNGTEEPANELQIVKLLQAINEEKVLNFVSDSAARLPDYNLSPAAVRIAISRYKMLPETAPDGAPAGGGGKLGITKEILQLGYRETENDATAGHRLFANFEGEPYIYEISPTFRENVPTHPLKWKDLKVLSFNPISLRSISRQIGGKEKAGDPGGTADAKESEPLVLAYDWRRDTWDAVGEAADAGNRAVDPNAARKLRDTLGSLSATRWLTPSPQAYQMLKTPAAVFEVTLETIDRATGDARETTHRIRFAKATALTYYGQIDDSPDVFNIDRATYRDLVIPVLTPPDGAR